MTIRQISQKIFRIFFSDEKLNISGTFFKNFFFTHLKSWLNITGNTKQTVTSSSLTLAVSTLTCFFRIE